jgi:RNA polymerase sigma factor (sigma-70 family)
VATAHQKSVGALIFRHPDRREERLDFFGAFWDGRRANVRDVPQIRLDFDDELVTCPASTAFSYPVSSPSTEPLTLNDQSRWFAEEVLPHERPLRSYLQRSLPSMADVDDLVQDCFARMMRAKTSGTIRSPKPLLFAIARNAVRDFISRKTRAELIPITESGDLAVLEEGSDVVESVCRRQELALLTEAIRALPERCREVLLLRKIKGLSQKEIAELLGIAEHTVEALAAKGTRRCAEYLRAHGMS